MIQEVMIEFARRTGLSPAAKSPRRYLWADAFAVCNYLGLYGRTGDQKYRDLALDLVDQVHHTLGRYREDDPRSGWISGRGEREGERHPTIGGLRIGKACMSVVQRIPTKRFWSGTGMASTSTI